MFSRNINKILLSATAFGLLTACAGIDKKNTNEPSGWFAQLFEENGQDSADKAVLVYLSGDYEKAMSHATDALKINPKNQHALLISALCSEKFGLYNRARQYYEDIIILDGDEATMLGSSDGLPKKIKETAKNNLRVLTIAQSSITVENKDDGTKHFALSDEAGEETAQKTITNALNKKTNTSEKSKSKNLDDIFSPAEKNIVSRFLILRELAEKDFITKDEFLSRRSANIGGLLPLTHSAPGVGIDSPVPSPDLIIERLEVLKEGAETRTITPREFSAERDVIIEALMSPFPRNRIKNKAPSKNILDAADDLRRLEILYDLNLITERERQAERKAIEKYLGIDNSPKQPEPAVVTTPTQTQAVTSQASATKINQTKPAEESKTPENANPNVSSPF